VERLYVMLGDDETSSVASDPGLQVLLELTLSPGS